VQNLAFSITCLFIASLRLCSGVFTLERLMNRVGIYSIELEQGTKTNIFLCESNQGMYLDDSHVGLFRAHG
jgi:hypothetical protein